MPHKILPFIASSPSKVLNIESRSSPHLLSDHGYLSLLLILFKRIVWLFMSSFNKITPFFHKFKVKKTYN